ncbi:HpcH/HpaI aldolase/citrate lyase family protein [Ancylobacter terrae]|uniref:HpcH/HpaI aldolase/citrate lyase family protein n=1 Tax=Ancylobacter sp. sgz301288 TaxID=3342077 RepID=UPI00385A3B05
MGPHSRFPTLRRSSLTVPLSSERFIAKAHLRGADAITLDLEDGVAPAAKPAARERLPSAVAEVGRGGADVGVRINRPLALAARDIEAAVIPGVSYLALAKVQSPDHIALLAELVAELEAERGLPSGGIGFTAAIETPQALARVNEIAHAHPRLFGIGLGSEDFAAACGMEPTAETLFVPKQMVVMAARAAGIVPLGFIGTVADYTDLEGLREVVRRSRLLGFRGASAIHPDQIPVLNAGFGPAPGEVERAQAILALDDGAAREGRGAFAFEGRMVDKPVVDRARETVALAIAIEQREARAACRTQPHP